MTLMQSYAQSPLPSEGSSWFNVEFGRFGLSGNWNQSMGGDTLIDGITYSKLLYGTRYQGALRSEGDQWLTIADGMDTEHVLYDFSLAVADAFWIDNPYHFDIAPYLILTSIDEVELLDGSVRTRWNFLYPEWTEVSWIEGIGSMQGIDDVSGCFQIDCGWSQLVCFHEADVLLYE
ncbi:MAG: hypothetical protein ACI898_001497 [Flavobacteriales bacterium]|jgi:hypothetical protein